MRPKGFISLSLTGYAMLGLSMIVLVLSIALKVQSARLDASKAEHQAFVSTVAEIGRQAEIKARAQEKSDKERKEKADEELRKLRIANNALNERLRNDSNRSVLPPTGTVAGVSETACFRRADLDAALQRFTGGVAEIVISGQQARDELENAKRWAQQ